MAIDRQPPADPALLRPNTQEDLLATGSRAFLSLLGSVSGYALAGPLGAIVGDLIVEFIPRQRQDRLSDFVEALNERVGDVEETVRTRIAESAGYASLFEQSLFAAVRTPNPQRRRDFAELLRSGLSKSEAQLVEHEMLFKLADRLNEPQILILYSYGAFSRTMNDAKLKAFYEAHPEVFGLKPPAMTDNEETIRRWAMHEAYVSELVTLGLLDEEEGVVKSAGARRVKITRLGRLLLDALGRTKEATTQGVGGRARTECGRRDRAVQIDRTCGGFYVGCGCSLLQQVTAGTRGELRAAGLRASLPTRGRTSVPACQSWCARSPQSSV